MSRTVTIDLPEPLYAALAEKAQQERSTPEQMILDSLVTAFGNGAQPHDEDQLLQLLGCIETDVTDIAERHHDYLGQALLDELRHGNET